MVQIINTLIIGLLVNSILSKKEKYKEMTFRRNLLIGLWCLLFFVAYGISTNVFFIFGPGVLLIGYSYWEHFKRKEAKNHNQSKT